jgi:hypothetical protein
MRAFLSTPDDGPAFLDGLYPGELDGPTIGMMGEWAVKEALMVLRVAEPGPIELARHVAIGAAVYQFEIEIQAALAGRLAAFVGGA